MNYSVDYYFRLHADHAILSVKLQPGARVSEIVGAEAVGQGEYALKVKLQAPPVEGRANDALLEFLAEFLGLPQRHFSIVLGATSRLKRVRVDGDNALLMTARGKLEQI